MGKNGALAAVLLIFVIAGASDALKFRVLMAEGKGDDKPSTQKVSPSPSPYPSPEVDPPKSSPAPQGPKTGEKDNKDKDPKGSHSSSGPGSDEDANQEAGCDGASENCRDADLVACLQHSTDDPKESFLLVQNRGEDDLNVNITTSIHIDLKKEKLDLPKHHTEKVRFSTNKTAVIKIVLNAGNGNCTLYIKPSISDWIQQFPAYATRLTPIHGAYFLFLSMVIAGGTWACCKFGRKSRRGDAGVPYQQLEMGTQLESSSSAADANMANGWDQSWDDAWDEEEGVARPSEKHPAGNVSSNGLSSRPPNKDGWDDNWDD